MTELSNVARASGALLFVSGCALMVGPLVLGIGGPHQHVVTLNSGAVGLILFGAGTTTLLSGPSLMNWVGLVAALWLVPSPWLLGYAALERAVWLDLVVAAFALTASHWGIAAAEMMRTERDDGDRPRRT